MSRGRDDHERTVFGGQNPGDNPNSDSPFGQKPQQQRPNHSTTDIGAPPRSGGGDRTMIGGAAPWQQGSGNQGYGQGQGNAWGAPPPQNSGFGQSQGREDTWIGAGAPQSFPTPPPQGGGRGASSGPSNSFGGGIGRPQGQDPGFFPEYQRDKPMQQQRHVNKIPLDDAMRVSEIGGGSSSNPLLASAASLLILLGRLRTGMVDLRVAPLMEHVTIEIDRFERNAQAAGIDPHEVLVAKYALSGTADDIVQNLPGSDRGSWQQYSMVARFFHKRDSGVGFFQEAEKAMQAPAQRYNLLELMLVCMSLGFEGQFRTTPNGAVELARIRKAIYETLRRVNPRPDEDIAVVWEPVIQDKGRRFFAVPLPVVLGGAALAVVALFGGLTTLINRDGAVASDQLLTLHQNTPVISIQRSPGEAYVAPIPQLDRIRTALDNEIKAGMVGVDPKGDFIALRVGNLNLFDLGKIEVKDGFAPVAARISQVLNEEGGPILVQGFTDNLPLSGRGQFKDNYQLSEARANAVREVLAQTIDDPARIRVEGKGEEEPVADNTTEEGRALNRRVEIMLAREGTYEKAQAAAEGAPAAPAAEPAPEPAATPAPAQEAGQ